MLFFFFFFKEKDCASYLNLLGRLFFVFPLFCFKKNSQFFFFKQVMDMVVQFRMLINKKLYFSYYIINF